VIVTEIKRPEVTALAGGVEEKLDSKRARVPD